MSRLLSRLVPRALVLLALLAATPAAAACFADYKASREPPLRLHYGVIALPEPACASRGAASAEIARRIAREGWTLLDVVSLFGPEGLNRRQADAGDFFLRF
jgi:hypothetical protein